MECIKVFIINHQLMQYELYEDESYVSLLTGAAEKNNIPPEYYRDDTGEHISGKNSVYAELTAHFWIWKNVKAEIVGLVHYRRYFVSDDFVIKLKSNTFKVKNILFYRPFSRKINPYEFVLKGTDLEKMFSEIQLYIGESINKKWTVEEVFTRSFGEDFCSKIKIAIENKCPDYLTVLHQVLDSHVYFMCNMFIGRKTVMDAYWEWLFDILDELERLGMEFHFRGYTGHDKRYAFAGELLFRVWVIKNNISYKSLSVVQLGRKLPEMENPRIYRLRSILRILLVTIHNRILHLMQNP